MPILQISPSNWWAPQSWIALQRYAVVEVATTGMAALPDPAVGIFRVAAVDAAQRRQQTHEWLAGLARPRKAGSGGRNFL